MSFKHNPWIHKDGKVSAFDEFITKESIYLFSGEMARPEYSKEVQSEQEKSNLINFMRKSLSIVNEPDKIESRRYDADKIQNV